MKTIIYTILMLIISILLFLLKVTGMNIHIILGILGLVTMISYTLLIKKEFKEYSKKRKVIEILKRVSFAIALISGFVLKMIGRNVILSNAHKIAALIFVILLLGISIKKIISKKQ